MTSSDVGKRYASGLIFLADICTYAGTIDQRRSNYALITRANRGVFSRVLHALSLVHMVWHRATLFVSAAHVGGVFLEVKHAPCPKESDPITPDCWDLLYITWHGMTRSTQISHGDQTRWQENVYRSTTSTCPGLKFLWHECWCTICFSHWVKKF